MGWWSLLRRDEVLQVLDAVDWSRTRSLTRLSDFVPDAYRRLIDSRDDAEASRAYWELDNEVVAQGTVYEAAAKLTPALLAALNLDLTPPARHRIVELLTEIALGKMDPKGQVVGSPRLEDEIHRQIRDQIGAVYGLMRDSDPRIRRAAFHVLGAVEQDREKLSRLARAVQRDDADEELRSLARRWIEDRERASP